jgi:nitrite reductase (cytochrome c-552)
MDALMELVADLEAAQAAGASAAALDEARRHQRRGQFYVDFVESENSNGFHAPQEATRILGDAIDYFRKGQMALRPRPGKTGP